MKTTDGYDLLKGNYYYLENGQCVVLNEFATTGDGRSAYMVTPFYEGEAMTASGSGGYHHEIHCPYEHEGEETMVLSIFKVAPIAKLCSTYKNKMHEIEQLSLAAGLLREASGTITREIGILSSQQKQAAIKAEQCRIELLALQEQRDKLQDECSAKRAELSAMEDSMPQAISDESVAVPVEEWRRLKKQGLKLECLENGGVSNWEWYGDSLVDFYNRYPE